MLQLRHRNNHAVPVPQDVFPLQFQDFAGSAETANPRQRHNRPPLRVGAGVQNLLVHRLRDEVKSACVRVHRAWHPLERVHTDDLLFDRTIEELLRPADSPRFGIRSDLQLAMPILGIRQLDRVEQTIAAEVVEKVLACLIQLLDRGVLQVRSRGYVLVEEIANRNPLGLLNQSDRRQLIAEFIGDPSQPVGRAGVNRLACRDRRLQFRAVVANNLRLPLFQSPQADRSALAANPHVHTPQTLFACAQTGHLFALRFRSACELKIKVLDEDVDRVEEQPLLPLHEPAERRVADPRRFADRVSALPAMRDRFA